MPASRGPKFLEHFKKAAALYQGGRVEDAVREFREAIRIDPNVAEARCNLGVALAKLGKDDEAVAELEAALRIDPKHAASWYNLGMRLEAKGRAGEAIKAYANFIANASEKRLKYIEDANSRIAALRRLQEPGGQTMTMGSEPKAMSLGGAEGTMTLGPKGEGTLTLGPGGQAPAVASGAGWSVGAIIEDLYEVRSVLGEGGFGSVHKVFHRGWELELAVKSPREDKVSNRRALERFVQEANTWVGLGLHPHITTCFFVRIIGGLPRIFIEYMEGGSLSDWLHSRKVGDAKTALDIAIQIARAMEHAHSRGLVHRDLKPGNCLMTPGGMLKVTDFGLAKVGEEEEESAEDLPKGAKIARVKEATQTGRLGTPEYMAPEQWYQAGKATGAADVWAFGVILHEFALGKKPFEMKDDEPPDAFYARMLESEWALKITSKMDSEMREVIASCLSPDPGKRPQDFRPLRERLERAYQRLVGSVYPREAVKETPLLADALNNQGVSMSDLGRADEALRLFEAALKMDPMHKGAAHNRRVLLGESKEALFVALPRGAEGARMEDSAFRALLSRAEQEISSGDWGKAYQTLGKARGVQGYERSAKALDLLQSLGLRGVRKGLRAGWRKALFAKSESALCACITADGKRILSGHEDKTLKLWDLSSGGRLWTVEAHAGPVAAVCLTPNGKHALTGGADRAVKLWDAETSRCVRTFLGHGGSVSSVCALPDGASALSAGLDRTLRLWDIWTGKQVFSFAAHQGGVHCIAASPDGKLALTCGKDKSLNVWNMPKGAHARKLEGHTGAVLSACILPDGRHALSASEDKTLKLWELSTGRCARTFEGHEGAARSVCSTPDGKFALSAGGDGKLKAWDISTGECVGTFDQESIHCVSMMPDARHALSAGEDGLGVWELDWKYSFPEQSDWDPGARPYAESFLGAHKTWTDADFKGLLEELGRRGFGWLKPDGVRRKLERASTDGWGEEGPRAPVPKGVWAGAAAAAVLVSAAFFFMMRQAPEVKGPEKPQAPSFDQARPLRSRPAEEHPSSLAMIKTDKPAAKPEAIPEPAGPKLNMHFIFPVAFIPGTARVSGEGAKRLKEAALLAPDYPQEQVEVIGYAGPSEPDAEALARNRAQIAADYLVGKARIPSGRVQRRSVVSGEGAGRAEIQLLSEAGEAVRASEPAAEGAKSSQGKAGIVWVRIPGGSFRMGTGNGDEGPAHQVAVKPFQMAKTEVTVAQYKACVDAGGCTAPDTGKYCNWGVSGRENHPVNCVDWNQAKKFSEWAGGRLPSEAEWEYAARSAGKDREYPWGDEDATCERAVISGCGNGTASMCSKSAGNTAQGLCDMAGNVWEWTQDWYHGSYNGAPSDGSAWLSPAGSDRVFRGGSWGIGAGFARAALRLNPGPGIRFGRLGFRPSRSQ
ncbi:MAG: SUMF1/EgtB/PvdO family nonheme iron enzyme [Elusimicrobia bacterium]|nr:SUMF1/EgtB/PvdO family nonheme iron enzyme [Elusimicrobiota bacterium]